MASLTMLKVLYDFFSYPFLLYIYIHLCCRRVKVEGQIVWLLEDELGSRVEEEEKEGG